MDLNLDMVQLEWRLEFLPSELRQWGYDVCVENVCRSLLIQVRALSSHCMERDKRLTSTLTRYVEMIPYTIMDESELFLTIPSHCLHTTWWSDDGHSCMSWAEHCWSRYEREKCLQCSNAMPSERKTTTTDKKIIIFSNFHLRHHRPSTAAYLLNFTFLALFSASPMIITHIYRTNIGNYSHRSYGAMRILRYTVDQHSSTCENVWRR